MCAPLVILITLIAVSAAAAETPGRPRAAQAAAGKTLPLRGPAGANPCAAYGPGFVRVESTGSCVKIGGALDVGVAGSVRR
ncbi:hypothetical protein [Bradyrhizobium sp.]|uniref:hypothetical protein n=1 Tax=Bradyrhizobium sp. TaxID=376 RepID=UPI0023836F8D|nr:hypothetical protein [Bradyrhizobium sp.]MDE2378933.1 hypothetical protein [Bradyrhizobium sp.]